MKGKQSEWKKQWDAKKAEAEAKFKENEKIRIEEYFRKKEEDKNRVKRSYKRTKKLKYEIDSISSEEYSDEEAQAEKERRI